MGAFPGDPHPSGGPSAAPGAADPRRAEPGVRDSRFRLLAEMTGQVVYERDVASGRTVWAGAVAQLTGYTPAEVALDSAPSWQALVHPEDLDAVSRAIALAGSGRRGYEIEYRLCRKDGSLVHVEERGVLSLDQERRVAQVLGSIVDIGHRRKLEQRAVQAQKMEAIGRLAGGVAHDFNNIICIIIGYAEQAIGRLSAEIVESCSLQEILASAERAASLTQQLLAFSREQVISRTRLNLNDVVLGLVPMLRRLVGEDVVVDTELAAGLPDILADAGQIEQLLMNLVANARDAMPAGGRLALKTTDIGDGREGGRPASAAGRVLLQVSDTGCGMTPEALAHIFEPFFTTKTAERGTGLGLATVHSIVLQNDGTIDVDSVASKGTTFSIYFPVNTDAERRAPAPVVPASAAGGETILLVEDDVELLRVIQARLVRRGYVVLVASGAQEAMAVASKHSGAIALLLTDVVLPGESGCELARQLVAERPALRTLYVSGYTASALARKGLAVEQIDLLEKPFTDETLQQRIRQALERSGAPGSDRPQAQD